MQNETEGLNFGLYRFCSIVSLMQATIQADALTANISHLAYKHSEKLMLSIVVVIGETAGDLNDTATTAMIPTSRRAISRYPCSDHFRT